jgi:Flp pilus assembly protein TadD
MSALSALQLAADAVEDARKRLERAKADADDDYEIRQALKHLDDATSYIRKATSEISQQG